MLFSKYANPFILLDQMISFGRFFDFIIQFVDLENERIEYEYWLYKVWDRTFDEFKNGIQPKEKEISEENLETTVKESKNILLNFVPQ